MSFDTLRKRTSMEDLIKKSEETGPKYSSADERYWYPDVDKAGNGYAEIRLLPAGDADDAPWVIYYDHGFKGPGGQWYIEKSLTSIGKDDPVSEYNSKLWNTGTEENKTIVRKQKRRQHYVSNIYVVSDPTRPENEGKVFLYRYGKKIFEKITEAMQPPFQDEEPINPFDFWEGANLKLKIRNYEGYRNYDKSEFNAPGRLKETDEELEAIYNQMYPLSAEVAEDQFKSYDELEKKLRRVLQLDALEATVMATEPTVEQKPQTVVQAAEPKLEYNEIEASASEQSEEEEDVLSYFQRLADEKE